MNYLLSKFIEFLQQNHIPNFIIIAIFSVFPFIIIVSFLIFTVMMLVLAERKLLAYFTQRKGPNRVGPWGIFQTVADGIKLLCKENIELINSNKFLFNLSPIASFSVIIILWCILPYNSEFSFINSELSLLIFTVITTFPMLFHFLAGISSNNNYSTLGAYRALALTTSYSIPFMISILSVICITNSMNLNNIIQEQTQSWIIFDNLIGFIIFYICSIAKLNRCPFDLSEAESELVCGYHTEYSGMRFGMFFLAEYAELFAMGLLVSILFLGGYLPPFKNYMVNIFLENCSFRNYLIYLEQTFWLVFKSCIIIFSIIWIRATLPRMTQNNILNLFWKYLTPISLINLIFIIFLKMGLKL